MRTDTRPVCYGYGRHSTAKQEFTRAAQRAKVKEYWRQNLKPADLPPLNGTASRERIWAWSKPREAINATRKEGTG